MKAVKFIIPIFLIFISCKNNVDKAAEDTGILKLNDFSNMIKISEVLELRKIIPLETDKEYLINTIDKVQIADDFIYILDKKTNTVFVANKKGKFIYKIERQGRGPNEYLHLDDIYYDTYENRLLLLDGSGKKLLAFSPEGEFKKIIKLDDLYSELSVVDENHIILYSNFYSSSGMQFTSIKKDGEVVSRFHEIPDKALAHSHRVIASNGEEVLYGLPFDKTIYKIKNNNYQPYLKLDFDDHFIKDRLKDLYLTSYTDRSLVMRINNVVTEINNLMFVGNVLYFSFGYKHQEYSVFMDYKSDQLLTSGRLITDKNMLFSGGSTPIGHTKEELVFAIEPGTEIDRYKRLIKDKEYASGALKFSSVFEHVNENGLSNPALLFFGIKKQIKE